ncbi:YhgE/Pip domain-containing protein [Clostridium chauvoei]|uniref:YhgE/Pip domain-containing protein n=1 Tax=Clostridium chauvoei TaxID=46867 RepID=UPI001C866251|nr:YhgE/Pip domain-containing protein [Clostridium chauvoei]MBX7405756.1 YhgE/Pip domain-containing protein [Clostridium chauvoei]
MKNIFKIFKRDLKSIVTNWVALIIILGLMLLPALYAWFNIKAGWDPYGNTKGIKVGIVNQDAGDNFGEKNINVGDELIHKLKDNNSLGWQFVNEEQGIDSVRKGKYYATIIIPEDFTKKILSIVSNDIQKPELMYKVNQKSNAIAPKITDKGVNTIKSQVDSTIVETVNGIIFKVLNETGVGIEEVRPKLIKFVDDIIDLNEKMPEIEDLVNKAYDGTITAEELIKKVNNNIPLVEETLNTSTTILNDATVALEKTKKGINDIAPVIKEDLQVAEDTLTSVEGLIDTILNTNIDKDQIISTLDNISVKVADLKVKITDMTKRLEPLGKLNPQIKNLIEQLNDANVKLDELISGINSAKDAVVNAKPLDKTKIQNLKDLVSNNKSIISNIVANYDSEYVPQLNKAVEQMNSIVDNTLVLVGEAKESMPQVKDLLNKLDLGVDLGKTELEKLKRDLPTIKSKIANIADKLSGLTDSEKIDELLKMFENDWQATSSFLASPVKISEDILFPIPNYGSAMSPFYSTLSLWVGALILVSLLTTDAHGFEEGMHLKPYEKYFGKFLTFAFIGICQSLIVSIGDMLLLKCYVSEPILFVGISVFISMVFIMIVYTLVSIFGNVGKAMSVILLVIQVAGSGGTFPIEVTTPFFQKVYPLLPFTYAISGMREAVGGVVPELLIKDLTILLCYFGLAIVVGLFLKGPINKVSKNFVEKLKESGLIGH